jgi:hypothetical protein
VAARNSQVSAGGSLCSGVEISGAGTTHQPPLASVTSYFAPIRAPQMDTRPCSSAFTSVATMGGTSHPPARLSTALSTTFDGFRLWAEDQGNDANRREVDSDHFVILSKSRGILTATQRTQRKL